MEEGEILHQRITKNQILSDKKDDYFNLYLNDAEEQFIAVLDKLVIFKTNSPQEKARKLKGKVVEFKSKVRTDVIDDDQKAQLVFQALVAEKVLNIRITTIAIETTDGKVLLEEKLEDNLKTWLLSKVEKLKAMLVEELIPDPPTNPGKCYDCECWPICLRA